MITPLSQYVENPTLQFAIKIMSTKYMENKESKKNIEKEVEILSGLCHDGIV
jgi:hypothetical protein